MKKGKMLIKMILCVLLIPLFIEAQVTDFDFIYTDINGKSNFEPFEQVKFERPENSRTAPVQVPGWPISIGQNSYFPPSGVCLADIFEDGLLAIIAGSSNGVFYVKNYQGNDFSGWPKTGLEPIRTKAAVGDIDPDYPGLEIVVPSETGTVYVWHNDGTPVTGWPQSIVNGVTGRCKSPVIFDIDNDGTLEIIIGQGNVNVFNHDGTMYPGWPKTLDGDCSATVSVADVDNDGVVEICALSWYSVYLSWNANTEPDLAGYNIYKSEISGGPYAKLNSTLITDTSYNDITGMENNYYCVTAEIKGSAESRLSNELFCLITSINEQYEQLSSISVSPNPFKHSATIIYTIHKPANISLEIYNSKGKLIETLIAEHQEAGRHSVVWNAANRSPGMYFY